MKQVPGCYCDRFRDLGGIPVMGCWERAAGSSPSQHKQRLGNGWGVEFLDGNSILFLTALWVQVCMHVFL